MSIEPNRRSFLRGALSLMGAAVVTKPVDLFATPAPIIWGDGIHDDTMGLQALFDNLPVDLRADAARIVRSDGGISLTGGRFLTTDTVFIRGKLPRMIRLHENHFIRRGGNGALIDVQMDVDDTYVEIVSNFFDYRVSDEHRHGEDRVAG